MLFGMMPFPINKIVFHELAMCCTLHHSLINYQPTGGIANFTGGSPSSCLQEHRSKCTAKITSSQPFHMGSGSLINEYLAQPYMYMYNAHIFKQVLMYHMLYESIIAHFSDSTKNAKFCMYE